MLRALSSEASHHAPSLLIELRLSAQDIADSCILAMAAAVLSPFESHRQRVLDAGGDEHASTLLHCSWPPYASAAEPTLSRAAAPYPHGSLLLSSGQAADACSEMLEARRLARAAKQQPRQRRRAGSSDSGATSCSALSDDDSLDLLIDAILVSEADSGEPETAWRR